MFNKIKSGWDSNRYAYSNRKDGLIGVVVYTTRHFISMRHEVIYEYYGNNLRNGGETYMEEYRTFGINAHKSNQKFLALVIHTVESVDRLLGT